MNWWRTRSLKFRLTCLHGVANLCTMGLLAGIVFFMIGKKMRADLDQQLQQDFSIVQSGLEYDHGRVEWELSAHSLDERLSAPNPHDEIGRLAGVFNQTFARLENAFEEMKRFTSDASHELRTPLTSLRAVGEVALKEPGNPDSGQEAIASMLEEAERLNDLTVYLLELARSDYGQALDTAPVRTRAIVGEVIETLNPVAAERRLTLRADVGPDLTALADRSLLRQALLNIVHNAILISPPGKEIVVRSGSCDAGVFMEVVDQGPGIPEEHQERVFDRFYRVDKARSRARGGFGLGLSIARASIERMGGTITLHSKPGEGACFRIELPTVLNKSSE